MTLTRSATALAFGIGLSLAAGPLAFAMGPGCPQQADQDQLGQNTGYQAQKTQGLPPSVQDRAQRADQDQLGQNMGRAQKADQPESGTQVASNCR